ncbi:MAG: hypothetical protein ACJ77N_12295 [Chloroflexota bacterium]|jgi:hypothetical protein
MRIITEDALLVCAHVLGRVTNQPSQHLVTVAGRAVLVEADPEGRTITSCPNIGATIKPCQHTLKVTAGYSTFVRIDGHAVCLDTVVGLTDGTPPGVVQYMVRTPGQTLVSSVA